MKEVIFLGRGGEGAFTSSRILGSSISLYENKYALSFPSFGPERRGAPVYAYTKISDSIIRDRSQSQKCDYFILLNESLYDEKMLDRLKENGKLIINSLKENSIEVRDLNKEIIKFPMTNEAVKYIGRPIVNAGMLGLLALNSGIVSIDSIIQAIKQELPPKVAEKNIKLIESLVTMG